VENLDKEMHFYESWLQQGYNASLGYMERNLDKRRDVSLILPGAQSVIVVTQNYYTPHRHPPKEDMSAGKISRYAWGDDYHDVIPPKLKELSAYITELYPDAATKYYTDTGPIMEKQWAVRAGVGWQGKHSNIISRKYGSWFFLGIIITTAQFVYDRPMEDYCGTCTQCIDACPTDAILPDKVIDGSKCISYFTIELKDQLIPNEMKGKWNDWMFGCDICMDDCPWNRFSKPNQEQRFQMNSIIKDYTVNDWKEITEDVFVKYFKDSPLKILSSSV
jgi:epoxyqueuosine reductase